MRRILAGAALGVALLLTGAGCDQVGTPSATPSASGAGSGSGSSAGTSAKPLPSYSVSAADTRVCQDTRSLVTDSTKKFGEAVVKTIQGGTSEAEVVASVKKLFTDWANGLRIQAGKADNADLKSSLLLYATALEKQNAQLNSIADLQKVQDLDTPELQDATEKLNAICG
jgi:hypothetical protein